MHRFCVVIFGLISAVVLAEPNSPHWIGPPRRRGAKGQVTLQRQRGTNRRTKFLKQFELNDGFQKVTLRMASDFCNAALELNGSEVKLVTPYDLPTEVDVTRHCKVGTNKIEVAIRDGLGPLAIAAEIKIVAADGKTRFVVSDSTWPIQCPIQDDDTMPFGAVDSERWWQIKTRPSTDDFDEYQQWKEAKGDAPDRGKDGAIGGIQIADGFEIETIYNVPKEMGSWISLTKDDKGRLIAGKEKKGIVRLTLREGEEPLIETINDELKGIHGLVWSRGSLFVNASDTKSLFRLDDTDGNDKLDTVRLLKEIPGGGGDHGRNDLIPAPQMVPIDQPQMMFYAIHGDAVDLPEGFTSHVTITHEFEDGRPKGGYVAMTNADGSEWKVIASGLRNPYGIASNRDSELFTFDADSERHTGLPWYRPTRMHHLPWGTDFGWRSRGGEKPWPLYQPDSIAPNVLIGRGSPTSIQFGYDSDFPPTYRDAMFTSDWSFGRVFAVHVIPRGASYSMHPEVFLRGRPLNVCDIEFVKGDGMYLLTGGYGTRSVLYRVRYTGGDTKDVPPTTQVADRNYWSSAISNKRRTFDFSKVHEDPQKSKGIVTLAWMSLSSFDPWVRSSARMLLEREPVERWEERIWVEDDWTRAFQGLLALVRIKPEVEADKIWPVFAAEDVAKRNPQEKLAMLRIAELLEEFHDAKIPDEVIERFAELYPSGDVSLDRELCTTLVGRDHSDVPGKTLQVLDGDLTQNDALHFLMKLAESQSGWTPALRESYFRLLDGAKRYKGDEYLVEVVDRVIKDALAKVPPSERNAYAAILEPPKREDSDSFPPREFVKKWSVDDFAKEPADEGAVDAGLGQRVFREAQCANCHRLGRMGRSLGPDLSGIAARFRREEIVESILAPSKSVSSRFANHVVTTTDGKTHTGQVTWNGFRKSVIRLATDPMRMDQVIEVSKGDIESHEESKVSPMPEGLLDSFEREEVESLLLFLMRGAD